MAHLFPANLIIVPSGHFRVEALAFIDLPSLGQGRHDPQMGRRAVLAGTVARRETRAELGNKGNDYDHNRQAWQYVPARLKSRIAIFIAEFEINNVVRVILTGRRPALSSKGNEKDLVVRSGFHLGLHDPAKIKRVELEFGSSYVNLAWALLRIWHRHSSTLWPGLPLLAERPNFPATAMQ
jgi:hypothetical protein